jgi:hypothetical protein
MTLGQRKSIGRQLDAWRKRKGSEKYRKQESYLPLPLPPVPQVQKKKKERLVGSSCSRDMALSAGRA